MCENIRVELGFQSFKTFTKIFFLCWGKFVIFCPDIKIKYRDNPTPQTHPLCMLAIINISDCMFSGLTWKPGTNSFWAKSLLGFVIGPIPIKAKCYCLPTNGHKPINGSSLESQQALKLKSWHFQISSSETQSLIQYNGLEGLRGHELEFPNYVFEDNIYCSHTVEVWI